MIQFLFTDEIDFFILVRRTLATTLPFFGKTWQDHSECSAVFFVKPSKSILSSAQCVAVTQQKKWLARFLNKRAVVFHSVLHWRHKMAEIACTCNEGVDMQNISGMVLIVLLCLEFVYPEVMHFRRHTCAYESADNCVPLAIRLRS